MSSVVADHLTAAQIAEHLRAVALVQARHPKSSEQPPLAFLLCAAFAFPGQVISIVALPREAARP